ncbi:MAG: cysteine hydrolase [Candidatus Methanomethylophilus sp.]|nr:cysteine hydrolase [Methanomethylophilus sp.]MCI2074472.1 cysteine hydrolase [Methanomethylophilus sp.]MCI2093871.1 cysteine hydrolase [Methanomethylophilus sp.]
MTGPALLLIDVQQGFVSERTEHAVPRIRELLDHPFGTVIATKFVNVPGSPYRELMGWTGMGSPPGTDLLDFVEERADYVIEKHIYTAVGDRLLALLKERGAGMVYIAGFDTDCCILKNAEDLFERGIPCRVLMHYTASNGGPASYEAARTVLMRSIGSACIIDGPIDGSSL